MGWYDSGVGGGSFTSACGFGVVWFCYVGDCVLWFCSGGVRGFGVGWVMPVWGDVVWA